MLVLMGCTDGRPVPIMMIGGIVMAMRQDLGLSWIFAAAVPVLVACVGFVVTRMVPNFRLAQARIDEVNRVLREQITGLRVVRAFVREPHETARFARANGELTAVSITAGRWMASLFPIVMLVVNVSSVAVIWFGGMRVDSGEIRCGRTDRLPGLPDADPDVGDDGHLHGDDGRPRLRVRRPRQRGPRHLLQRGARPPTRCARTSSRARRARRRGFAYPGADEPVLREVSLSARPGQTVAVIG